MKDTFRVQMVNGKIFINGVEFPTRKIKKTHRIYSAIGTAIGCAIAYFIGYLSGLGVI